MDKNVRVKSAFDEKGWLVRELFEEKGCSSIFIRIFKLERKLEIWAAFYGRNAYEYIKSYQMTCMSGMIGPKRREGDKQIPEGFYIIDRFNPNSKYYLSLGIDYPNKSDKILGDKTSPGKDIFIHGGSSSVGCIAIGDESIKELYIIAQEASAKGQLKIPIHIFPAALNSTGFERLKKEYINQKDTMAFWNNIKAGYDIFERNHTLPEISVDDEGRYLFFQECGFDGAE